MTVSEAPVPTAPAHSRTSASWLTKWASGQGLMKTHNSIITVLKTNLLGAICRLMTLDLVLTGSPCSRHCCHGWACSWPLHGQETMEGNPWSCKLRSAFLLYSLLSLVLRHSIAKLKPSCFTSGFYCCLFVWRLGLTMKPRLAPNLRTLCLSLLR